MMRTAFISSAQSVRTPRPMSFISRTFACTSPTTPGTFRSVTTWGFRTGSWRAFLRRSDASDIRYLLVEISAVPAGNVRLTLNSRSAKLKLKGRLHVEPNIPPALPQGAELAGAQARVDQLLDALHLH